MDLGFTEIQQMLKNSAREFLRVYTRILSTLKGANWQRNSRS